MATTYCAVETKWHIEYKTGSAIRRNIVTDPNQIPVLLRRLQKMSVATVTLTEMRTCTAMPGLVYQEASEIDLREVIIKLQDPEAPGLRVTTAQPQVFEMSDMERLEPWGRLETDNYSD